MEPIDFAERRRRLRARDDGTCKTCGGPRVICSRMGRECVFREPDVAEEPAP